MPTQHLRRPTIITILSLLIVLASGNGSLLASSFQPDEAGIDSSRGSTVSSALPADDIVDDRADDRADDSDAFFDDSTVHEIYLTFDADDYGATGWYNTLYDSHANDTDDPYFPASFSGDGVTIETVGVRFKGNSSFNANSASSQYVGAECDALTRNTLNYLSACGQCVALSPSY